MTQHTGSRLVVLAAVLLAAVPVVSASVTDPALVLTASNANGTATLSIPLSQFTYDPGFHEYDYVQPGPVNLYSGAQYVAQVKALSAFLVDDAGQGPSITLQYTLLSGDTQTNFTVDNGLVSFAAIPAAAAAAAMSDTFVITDLNYDGNVWLAALNNHAYKTLYGQAGGGEIFFHGSDSVGAFGGTSVGGVYNAFDNYPATPGQYQPLGVAVDRIRTTAGFSLTALDSAQVQTTFVLVPEPAMFGLAALAALLLRRR